MNLEDVVGDRGIKQDKWSRLNHTFGSSNQIKVLGFSGDKGKQKFYIVVCDYCSKDSDLFGQGYFRSSKGNLINGQLPCGCSSIHRWSEEQQAVRCSRKAAELGYKFLGFVGDWKGNDTKIKMLCEKHGEWVGSCITNLLFSGCGCTKCKAESVSDRATKPDEIMVSSFFASGAFHPDTKFYRSERKTNTGFKAYWDVYCPVCGQVGVSLSSNLQKGGRCCGCSRHNQKEAYINLIKDKIDDEVIAIKFGIASISLNRARQQNYKSIYKIENHSIYMFESTKQCRNAEKECKQHLECGVLTKYELPDGYTETTWVYNLDKIIEIYEQNGGFLNKLFDTH